jgi:hypothetical protein
MDDELARIFRVSFEKLFQKVDARLKAQPERFPHYTSMTEEQLRERLFTGIQIFINTLESHSSYPAFEYVENEMVQRLASGYSSDELMRIMDLVGDEMVKLVVAEKKTELAFVHNARNRINHFMQVMRVRFLAVSIEATDEEEFIAISRKQTNS